MKKEELIKKYMNNELCIKRNGASDEDCENISYILEDKYNDWRNPEYEWLKSFSDKEYPDGMQVITVQDFLKACEESDKPEEITREELITEAKKRGYVNGARFECLHGWTVRGNSEWVDAKDEEVEYTYHPDNNELWVEGLNFFGLCIYQNGEWAKFLETDKEEDYSHLIGKEVEVRDVDDDEWKPRTFLGVLKMLNGSVRYFISVGDDYSVSFKQMREKQETIHLEKGDYTKEELEEKLNELKQK